jgi:hypothetical protein
MVMNGLDFSPLFRSTIGFDRMLRLVDATTRVDSTSLGYPPYNIEKTGDDAYRLTMAVAGFSPDELDVTAHENVRGLCCKIRTDHSQWYLPHGAEALYPVGSRPSSSRWRTAQLPPIRAVRGMLSPRSYGVSFVGNATA